MSGFGDCRCCKKYKKLTTHHDKQLNEKVMICRDCHNIIEEYIKIQVKVSKEIVKGKKKTNKPKK